MNVATLNNRTGNRALNSRISLDRAAGQPPLNLAARIAGRTRRSPGFPGLSGDLRLLVGECALIQLSLDAVAAVAPELPVWRDPLTVRFDPHMLLTLLTYSYAAGSQASEDIEWDCQHDPATRFVTSNTFIARDTLRAFRRAHRRWIEACLAWVLEGVSEKKGMINRRNQPGILQPEARAESPYLTRAKRRLELAILMDAAMAD